MNKPIELNIGIAQSDCKEVGALLNVLLADEYVLYTKTRNYHWNVVGPNFNELHRFLEQQYGELDESIDAIAERARSLGAKSVGTLADFLKLARLREHSEENLDARQMLENLLCDHETIIRNLRKDVEVCTQKLNDVGTADFLTGLMESHEKMAWMLRAFLQ